MRLIDADEEAKWASEHILDAKERHSVLDFLRDCSTVDVCNYGRNKNVDQIQTLVDQKAGWLCRTM